MSRDASITEPFGDADYVFRLAWGELTSVQESCDAGPFVVLDRLMSGRWLLNDIREVIRFGLIGGGLEPTAALKLMRTYVEARPPHESLGLARKIMTAGVVGAPDEDARRKKGKAPSQGSASTASRTESSGLEPSTASARRSGSRRKT